MTQDANLYPEDDAPTVDPDYPDLLEILEVEQPFNDLDQVYADDKSQDPDEKVENLPEELREARLGLGFLSSGRTILASRVAANALATSRRGTYWGVGHCLQFSRTMAGAAGGVHDATDAWYAAQGKHTTGTPPAGFPVYWTGGLHGYGHVAISAGGGYVWSTDYYRLGRVDRVAISTINRNWGNLNYRGWAESINGVRILKVALPPEFKPPAGTKGIISVDDLLFCAKHEIGTAKSYHPVQVRIVSKRLHHFGALKTPATGHWSKYKRDATRRFQKGHGLAVTGLPDRPTLVLLMKGTHWAVKPSGYR